MFECLVVGGRQVALQAVTHVSAKQERKSWEALVPITPLPAAPSFDGSVCLVISVRQTDPEKPTIPKGKRCSVNLSIGSDRRGLQSSIHVGHLSSTVNNLSYILAPGAGVGEVRVVVTEEDMPEALASAERLFDDMFAALKVSFMRDYEDHLKTISSQAPPLTVAEFNSWLLWKLQQTATTPTPQPYTGNPTVPPPAPAQVPPTPIPRQQGPPASTLSDVHMTLEGIKALDLGGGMSLAPCPVTPLMQLNGGIGGLRL